jgi:hypothetical protein
MRYVANFKDMGIILSPDKENEKYFNYDGGGIREAIINKVNDTYYLFYDGAIPGETNKSYWCACLAKSKDLTNWVKAGRVLNAGIELHENSNGETYKDFKSASSPWVYCENGKWYMCYVGAENCSPEGIPALPYHTLPATACSIEGPWKKVNEEKGKEKTVCFYSRQDRWNSVTSSPGHVMRNPKWEGENDTVNKKYLMFFSGCYHIPVYARSIGIARTNSLDTCDAYDSENPSFWEVDENPIIPISDDIENSSVYYEEKNGYYFLFTNHVYKNAYTDSVWVYWTKDIEKWNQEDKAIVIDKNVSTWAKGAIGLATAVKIDDNTLALVYDGIYGEGTGHLGRHIGLAYITLPLDPDDFK